MVNKINIKRMVKYIKNVESDKYDKIAWKHFHNGNIKIWNRWASRLQLCANLKYYYNLYKYTQKEVSIKNIF